MQRLNDMWFGGRFIEAFEISALVKFSDRIGKPVWQLVMALEDVEKNEYDRLKEFGIRIKIDTKIESANLGYSILFMGEEKKTILAQDVKRYLKFIIQ